VPLGHGAGAMSGEGEMREDGGIMFLRSFSLFVVFVVSQCVLCSNHHTYKPCPYCSIYDKRLCHDNCLYTL
jgi:hypothetical protein